MQIYGMSIKSDFGGHGLSISSSLFLFASAGNQYQASVPSLRNAFANSTVVAAGEGEVLIHAGCPPGRDATMSPLLRDLAVLSPEGNATLCGAPLARWGLPGVAAGRAPTDAAVLIAWAREMLGM